MKKSKSLKKKSLKSGNFVNPIPTLPGFKKYARYFVEGYDAYGIEQRLMGEQKRESGCESMVGNWN